MTVNEGKDVDECDGEAEEKLDDAGSTTLLKRNANREREGNNRLNLLRETI